MKRWMPLACALSLGLLPATGALAQAETQITRGTPVTLVGVISSQPRDLGVGYEGKMQVAVGPERTDHTLHIDDAAIYGPTGEELAKSDLLDKWWIRAEGQVMKDPRRIKVERLYVLSRDYDGFQNSSYFRPGMELGYVETVAGERQVLESTKPFKRGERVLVIGEITSEPVLNEDKMQVAVGPQRVDYTLHFEDGQAFGPTGEKYASGDFDNKQWVVAEGKVMKDARRIKVTRMQVLGKDWDAYRNSGIYRSNWDRGIVTNKFDRNMVWPMVRPQGAAAASTFSQGTPVVVVGEVTSEPKAVEEKMQVGVGPAKTDYTLHLSDARMFNYHGQNVDEDHFEEKMWIRAEGRVMDDPRRIKVERVQVIGMDLAGLRSSAFHRPGFDQGYVTSVAGTRETFPSTGTGTATFSNAPMTIVGKVTDDTDPFHTTRKLQVQAAGNEWTLNVNDDAMVLDAKGEPISIHSVDQGQWIRATGWQTDDLRMRVLRVENLGADEAFRTSQAFRSDWPLGYVDRVAGERQTLETVNLEGTVVNVYPDRGYVVLRDRNGREHWVYTDSASITVDNRQGSVNNIQEGDRIKVRGRVIAPFTVQ